MYDRIGDQPGIAPEVLLAADRVVTRGSVAGPAG
jgi:hypothetical protein